ncbi:MAG: cupin domain-containing protein, partial [Candidatus Eisenbacteria bacterium]|nr:cupin domain-containing protein [Candidatus Eisenbacteria bacterium]
FLAPGNRTGGLFALVEEEVGQGVSVPLHRHDDVESFYILEGEISFFLGEGGGQRGGPGTFVHIPGGTVHGFRVESATARYLILTTPHHEAFYRAITVTSPDTAVDDGIIGRACADYGIEFVGPLPT